ANAPAGREAAQYAPAAVLWRKRHRGARRNFIARLGARAAWAALGSLCVFGWCFAVMDKATGETSPHRGCDPFGAVPDLVSVTDNDVAKSNKPIDPQVLP